MRRFFIILGVALIVFSVVILVVFIIAPAVFTMDDAPLLKGIMQTVACKPGETLSASYSTYSTPGSSSRNTDLSCVDKDQNASDVSQQLISIGAVGYLGPFLIGMFMTLLAANSSKKSKVSTTGGFNDAPGYFTEHHTSAADDRRARKEAARRDHEKQAARQAMHDDRSAPLPDHTPLAQRLQELKDAYSQGLVTEAEYATKRKALLDEE